MVISLGLLSLLVGGAVLVVPRAMRWGSTPEERVRPMAGDAWLEDGVRISVRMTRAITTSATPEAVWPWLAQMGRGAGWYSIDRLDNGGRRSARHLVSWIPTPRLGDATSIGYLRHLAAGRELAWWIPGTRILGTRVRSVMAYRADPQPTGTRVISRMSWDAAGATAALVVGVFIIIDSIMARRQLVNLKERAERFDGRASDSDASETGRRDQYQLHHVIYASGEEAGVPGREEAAIWRRAAERDGVIRGRPMASDIPPPL